MEEALAEAASEEVVEEVLEAAGPQGDGDTTVVSRRRRALASSAKLNGSPKQRRVNSSKRNLLPVTDYWSPIF